MSDLTDDELSQLMGETCSAIGGAFGGEAIVALVIDAPGRGLFTASASAVPDDPRVPILLRAAANVIGDRTPPPKH